MTARAIRRAAATASLPVVAKIACSAPGTISTRSSASWGSELVLRAVRQVALELASDGIADDPRGVAQKEWSVAEGEVDVALAVDVPQIGALAALEVERMRACPGPDARRHTTRDDPTGGFEEGLRAWVRRGGHGPRLSGLETPSWMGEPEPSLASASVSGQGAAPRLTGRRRVFYHRSDGSHSRTFEIPSSHDRRQPSMPLAPIRVGLIGCGNVALATTCRPTCRCPIATGSWRSPTRRRPGWSSGASPSGLDAADCHADAGGAPRATRTSISSTCARRSTSTATS